MQLKIHEKLDSNKRKDGRVRKIHTKQRRCDQYLYELIQESRLRITANNDYSNNTSNRNGGGEVGGGIAEAAVLVAAAATVTMV